MFSTLSYRVSPALKNCWFLPLEHIGCTVERLSDRLGHQRWLIKRKKAKIMFVGGKEDLFLLSVSSLFERRGKNVLLARDFENVILASGAAACDKPMSSNRIYRINIQPSYSWLKLLESTTVKIKIATSKDSDKIYISGTFNMKAGAIAFFTGPAVEPDTKHLTHFVAIGLDTAGFRADRDGDFLQRLDQTMKQNGILVYESKLN